MLLTLCLLPLLGAFILCFIDRSRIVFIRNFSLIWSLIILNVAACLLLYYNPAGAEFQLITHVRWLQPFNINLILGLDGLALFFIILTAFLIPVCVLLCWTKSIQNNVWEYVTAFFLLETILFVVFCSLDLMLFYLFFEAVLLPMYAIIGIYGSRERRIRSSYLLFLYTLISSIVMFAAILFIFFAYGTTDYLLLKTIKYDIWYERFFWFAFFLSFAVKMPLVPFHIWLPEAHCEAPTAGSVILAGILLKLGGFGFLRYSVGLFPDSSAFFTPFIYIISILGIVYASITTMQQIDLKKIIAYSSVGHMGVVTIGIFSSTPQGVLGSILLMISHGIVSSALFLCVGMIYERHHTRIIKYYSGLLTTMPIFSSFFLLFTMGNIGLPGTSSFVGEFLIIMGCLLSNSFAAVICGLSMVLGGGYSLWLLNRILFGNIKNFSILVFCDSNRMEFNCLLPFVFLTLILGFFPELITHYISAL